MLTERCPLVVGLPVGDRLAVEAVLRQAKLSDAYTATLVVDLPDADLQADVRARMAYQMAIDDAELLARVVELADEQGAIPVPGLEALLATIDPEDMACLRAGAERLKKKRRGSKPASDPSAPSKAGSSP